MQQATVNILADMGAQPGTLIAEPGRGHAVGRHHAADRQITSPAAGATLTNGNVITVTGTATDAGGGVVAASRCRSTAAPPGTAATGTTSWSYTGSLGWHRGRVDQGPGRRRQRQPADAGGEPAGDGPCPCSIFGLGSAPTVTPSSGDTHAVEVGVKFSSDVNGWITGVRFYKGTGNTGPTSATCGARPASCWPRPPSPTRSATGWQQATSPSPVAVTAGTTYVASYYAPAGHYAEDDLYFNNATRRGAVARAWPTAPSGGNGVYHYGADAFPTSTFAAANYWVDASSRPRRPPTPCRRR